jgi:hypothetical protein
MTGQRSEAVGGNALEGDALHGQTVECENGITARIWSGGRGDSLFLSPDGGCGGCSAQKCQGKEKQGKERQGKESSTRGLWTWTPVHTAYFRRLFLQDHNPKDAVEPWDTDDRPWHPGAKPERGNSRYQYDGLSKHSANTGFGRASGFQVVFIRDQPTQTACLYTND